MWPLLTSLQLAKEYALTGDRIPARRAAEIGLVNHVCADGEVLDQAMACAHRIAALPKGAVEDTKRVLNIQLERAVLAALDFALARRTGRSPRPSCGPTSTACSSARARRQATAQVSAGTSTIAVRCEAPTAGVRRRRTVTTAPRCGVRVTWRTDVRSHAVRVGSSSMCRSTSASTTRISVRANAAPRQRRLPPPNGIHTLGSGRCPTKRSGRKTSGSG